MARQRAHRASHARALDPVQHNMPASIAFFHTSPVHVATFDGLVQQLDADHVASHVVDESILADARRLGPTHADIVWRVNAAMHAAAAGGAKVVVCTCSTVGDVAERTDTRGQFVAMRVDRAMADEAVCLGPSVLVIAALESSLAPTRDLIEDSATRLGKPVRVRLVSASDAWAHFEKGDTRSYHVAVANAVRSAVADSTVVVLAQASMAGAATLLEDVAVPVLSSPRLGVRAANHLLQSLSAASKNKR